MFYDYVVRRDGKGAGESGKIIRQIDMLYLGFRVQFLTKQS